MSAGKCRELHDALTVVPFPGLDAVALGAAGRAEAQRCTCRVLYSFSQTIFPNCKQTEENSGSDQFLYQGWEFWRHA